MIKITTHTIVKNEENWVWFAINSVKDQVTKMLVFDDCSTDRTVEMISKIDSPKIEFESRALSSPADHTKIRNQMIRQTKTDWFLLLDGDEIWNPKDFKRLLETIETCGPEIYGIVVETRNCVGDVYHYLPQDAGNYQLVGKKGHLSIRAYRKLPNFSWKGDYPLEAYTDANGHPINSQIEHLKFLDVYYWHMTHLPRTVARREVKGWRTAKIEAGIVIENERPLPPILFEKPPVVFFDPLKHRSLGFEVAAGLITPLKKFKRKFL